MPTWHLLKAWIGIDVPVLLDLVGLASALWPWEASPQVDRLTWHLLVLEDAGLVRTGHDAAGSDQWLWLPDQRNPRPRSREAPPPPAHPPTSRASPAWSLAASARPEKVTAEEREGTRARAGASTGGQARASTREWVRDRVEAEQAVQHREWERWELVQEQEPRRPERPPLLDAPPIGCPEHPKGRYRSCGPCRTARDRREEWRERRRYEDQLAWWEDLHADTAAEQQPEPEPMWGPDDEPF